MFYIILIEIEIALEGAVVVLYDRDLRLFEDSLCQRSEGSTLHSCVLFRENFI